MLIGHGHPDRYLTDAEVRAIVAKGIDAGRFDGQRVLVLIPDGTRTMPMPLMFTLFEELLRPPTKALDYLVALGTHPPMTDVQLSKLIGHPVHDSRCGEGRIFNHRWEDPATFVTLGHIAAAETSQITGGRLVRDVPVSLNKLILDYDHIVVCG